MSNESLIEFPANIAVKAMGLNDADFTALIEGLVLPLIESQDAQITTLPSKGGKYLSVSVRFKATSLEQLHSVYSVLRSEARVLYTL